MLLRSRLTTRARVLRDGEWQSVPAASLVPGDCVHLRMGDLSPADIRIVDGTVLLGRYLRGPRFTAASSKRMAPPIAVGPNPNALI